ncbi:MFS transporter [Herbaspirillum sp. ST 5-3]|uniref:MFS transporter n=1 Tax=Oxalobacteraceae TaxID=75682 RepID=UPI0010A4C54D|nr:MFS transporter [Herbaspirillum sp. ST 5-3]
MKHHRESTWKRCIAATSASGVAASPDAHGRFPLLVTAVFTVSLSANIVTPLLPFMLNALALAPALQERNAAFLNGTYLLAMFVSAPLLGHLSDRISRRSVLLAGIGAFTLSLYALARSAGLAELYASRILSGIGAGGVLPILLAHVSEHHGKEQRVRRFAWLVTAIMTGSLIGPYLGGLAAKPASWTWLGLTQPANLIVPPVLTAAFASSLLLIGVFVAFDVRPQLTSHGSQTPHSHDALHPRQLYTLFAFSIILMYAVGSFEVGLATVARIGLQLDAAQLGMMYAECALVMLIMQAFFFSEQFKNFANHYLIGPAIAVTAVALALFPSAGTHAKLAVVIAAVAGGAGVIAPLISYRVSVLAGGQQGKNFGLQSASSSLGQAMGSAGSGLLFGLDRQLPFWLAATILIVGSLLIFMRLPSPHQLEA